MVKEKIKRLYGSFIIMIVIAGLSFFLVPTAVTEADGNKTVYQALNSGISCESGDCRGVADAYAYQISIWNYDKGKEPVQITKPILVYNPKILETIELYYSVGLPGSYDQLTSTNYGLQQIIDLPDPTSPDDKGDWHGSGDKDPVFEGLGDNVNTGSSTHHGIAIDPITHEEYEYETKNQYYYTWGINNAEYTCVFQKKPSGDLTTITSPTKKNGRTGFQYFYQSFMTKARKVTYKKEDVDLSGYLGTYPMSNLKSAADIDDFVKNTLGKDRNSVLKYFGIDLHNYTSEVDNLYYLVEPVERVLTGIKRNTGTFFIKRLIKKIKDDSAFTTEDKYWKVNNKECLSKCTTYGTWQDVACMGAVAACKTGKHTEGGVVYEYRCQKEKRGSCPVNTFQQKRKVSESTCPDDKCTKWKIIDYKLKMVATEGCGKKQGYYLYGRKSEGYSTLKPSRKMGSSSYYLQRAVNSCSDNANCVLEDDMVTCKKDASGNIMYQYYIGPDQDRAWVGPTSSNPYKIKGMSGSVCTGYIPESSYEGFRHYFIPDILDRSEPGKGCQEVCGGIGNKASDEYLKCSENYCDSVVNNDLRGNPRIRKKNCILKKCEYKYGKVPEGGKYPDDLESKNSCNNANPYKGKEKLLLGSNSDCNKNVASGNLMQKEKGVTVSCKGDRVTDFDNDDTNDTIFDQRTYINTACMETTSFEYEDLKTENTDLKPGSPINYYVNQEGERKCTYFFNLEQWKFDYASIPSKDLDRRKRLKYIYTTFNHAYDKSYDPKTNAAVYDKDFEDNNDGTIEVQKYDIEKTQVMSKVKEIIENKPKTSASEILIRQDEKENTVYNVIKKETLYSYENTKEHKTTVSRYESISTSVATYRYNKRCLTTDGEAKVYTPEGDICHTTKTGEDKLAKYAYYTNLKATYDKDFSKPDYEHKVYTTATVGIESSSGNLYYSNNESCKYTLDKPEQGPGCIIKITQEAGTDLLGNNVYEGGAVKAKVVVLNEEGLEKTDRIGRIELTVNGVTEVAEEKIIPIGEAGDNDSRKDYKIVGKVTTKNGLVSTCEKEIILLKHSNCGATCSVNKINGKLYEIVGVSANSILKSTILNMERTSVAKTINEEKYYVTAPEEIKEKDMIIGYVVNGDCNEYCYYPLEKPTGQSCTSLYKPAELGNIIAYCNANYRTDLNNYKSTDECIKDCSNACPNECRNEKDLQKYCENPERLGFESENECLNRCYCPYSEDGYLFRSIHNHDPFPNSPNSPYAKGNRGIGKNWYAREEYIIDDSNDETSVTGDYANQQVEYIMALDIDDIKMIRNENNNDGKEAYTKLIYSSQTEDDNYVGEYKSKLLNDTLAGEDIFINAMNGKKAKYVPG